MNHTIFMEMLTHVKSEDRIRVVIDSLRGNEREYSSSQKYIETKRSDLVCGPTFLTIHDVSLDFRFRPQDYPGTLMIPYERIIAVGIIEK